MIYYSDCYCFVECVCHIYSHAVIGQHVALTSAATMAGGDTHAPHDPTMFFIFLVVAATGIILLWLIRRSKQQSSDVVEKVREYSPPGVKKAIFSSGYDHIHTTRPYDKYFLYGEYYLSALMENYIVLFVHPHPQHTS